MSLLKTLSSYQLATLTGCLSFAVATSRLEKSGELSCSSFFKRKALYHVGHLVCLKATEKISSLAWNFFNKKELALPHHLSENPKNKAIPSFVHLGLGMWAIYEICASTQAIYEDGDLLLNNEYSLGCSGYLLSALLANIGKVQVGCETLFKTISYFNR